jgi:hypothetical protein
MARQRHGDPVGGQAGQDGVHMLLAGRVEAVGRLVEDQQVRAGEQGGGQAEALTYAEGEAADPVVGQVGEPDLIEGLRDTDPCVVAALGGHRVQRGQILPGFKIFRISVGQRAAPAPWRGCSKLLRVNYGQWVDGI